MKRILVVDDQPTDIGGPYNLVLQLGYQSALAFDGGQALMAIQKYHFDLVILDWNMPNMGGQEFLDHVETGFGANRNPLLKIVLHSGEAIMAQINLQARHFELVDIWPKPFRVGDAAKRLQLLLSDKQKVG